ncbi:CLC_0170 family protein [Cohnella panacarvi]|uniref:CLC_0170 family protein n=1 Tax=Cohnella panacarvi TaxID=400776 RepID=UPI00047E2BFE|nr:CLC_0170 family protein [Cohnella panacarvi]
MGISEYAGSVGYVIPIWIITGILILILDINIYKTANMNKEKKLSKVLGWLNISFGVAIYVAYRVVNWMQ